MKYAAAIDHISPTVVRAFAFMVEHPSQWFTAADLNAATGISKATLYRRFGNLVAASALVARQVGSFRHFKLHPDWRDSKLGAELQRRALQRPRVAQPPT